MELLFRVKRPLVRFSRFRHRCGYGVHSPFAFNLIRDVVYEKLPYYAYKPLQERRKQIVKVYGWEKGTQKVNHLLFRLVNRMQPATIIEVGQLSATALYLQSAKPSAKYLFAADLSELFLETDTPVDFLYLDDCHRTDLLEKAFQICAHRTVPKSVFVIRGIHYSKQMNDLWKRAKEDEHVGVTFDLYDLGLLFFDKTKIKQHYIVSF